MMMAGYRSLAAGIIHQAVVDLRVDIDIAVAKKYYTRYVLREKIKDQAEAEMFLEGKWFEDLAEAIDMDWQKIREQLFAEGVTSWSRRKLNALNGRGEGERSRKCSRRSEESRGNNGNWNRGGKLIVG